MCHGLYRKFLISTERFNLLNRKVTCYQATKLPSYQATKVCDAGDAETWHAIVPEQFVDAGVGLVYRSNLEKIGLKLRHWRLAELTQDFRPLFGAQAGAHDQHADDAAWLSDSSRRGCRGALRAVLGASPGRNSDSIDGGHRCVRNLTRPMVVVQRPELIRSYSYRQGAGIEHLCGPTFSASEQVHRTHSRCKSVQYFIKEIVTIFQGNSIR